MGNKWRVLLIVLVLASAECWRAVKELISLRLKAKLAQIQR